MNEPETPDVVTEEAPPTAVVPRNVTPKAPTVTRLLVVGGVLLVTLLAMGIVVALLGLRSVQQELAELKAARGPAQAQARRQPPPPPALPTEPISIDGAALKGSKTARVVIVEFSDFQCPFCVRFTSDTLPELDRDYISTGKVLLAFRHMPIDELHPAARAIHTVAECAGRQGKFWEMHDRLFEDARGLNAEKLQTYAKEFGLGGPTFESCLKGGAADRITSDLAEAQRLQVYGTPGFLIGTLESDGRVKVLERLAGAEPTPKFRAVLNRLLAGAD